MAHKIIPLRDHPSNLDHTAVWVSGMHEPGMVFRVNGGYLATIPAGDAFEGLFASEQEARTAIASVA